MALGVRKRCEFLGQLCRYQVLKKHCDPGVNYNEGEVSPKLFVKYGERVRGIIENLLKRSDLSLRNIRISKRAY
jgi:hypothetical protein